LSVSPFLYKTTKEFLVQFGLKDLNELPSLKEFEELRRLAFSDADEPVLGAEQPPQSQAAEAAAETEPEQLASAAAEAALEEAKEKEE
jgi:hypothetical protein